MTGDSTVIFTHVPKVAGTSIMRQLIRANYTKDEIKVYVGERDLIRHRGKFKVLVGHSSWGVQKLVPGPVKLFTMLRNPEDRAVSHYFFIKQPPLVEGRGNVVQRNVHNEVPLSGIFAHNAKRKWRLAGTWLVDNMQTRYLAGYAHYWKSGTSASLLRAAKRNLQHGYTEFGLQSDYAGSVERIAEAFGWRLGDPVKLSKTTRIDKTVTEEDMEAVQAANVLDADLYDFASELFRKRGMP